MEDFDPNAIGANNNMGADYADSVKIVDISGPVIGAGGELHPRRQGRNSSNLRGPASGGVRVTSGRAG